MPVSPCVKRFCFGWGWWLGAAIRGLNEWWFIIFINQHERNHHFLQQGRDQPVHRKMHHHPSPQELHPRRTQLLPEVTLPSFRCTRNLPKLQPTIGRLRSDSEELAFRMGALWAPEECSILILIIFLLGINGWGLWRGGKGKGWAKRQGD